MTKDICSFVNMFFSEKIGKILILIKVFADFGGNNYTYFYEFLSVINNHQINP